MPALTPEQLAARKLGIGGSDAAAALGISPWKTRFALWTEKRNPVTIEAATLPTGKPDKRLPRTWGTLLEDAIATRLAEVEGCKLARVNITLKSAEHPFMLAHVDRAFVRPHISGRVRWSKLGLTTDRIAEIKNIGFLTREWGDEGTDEIPVHYLAQGVHMLIVTHAELCVFGVLVGGQQLRRWRVGRRPDVIDMVIDGEREFWRMVEDGAPPPVVSVDDVKLKWQRASGGVVEATSEIQYAVERMVAIDKDLESLKLQRDQYEIAVRDFLGENAILTHMGLPVVTWKNSKGRKGFDTDALQRDYPALYEKYARIGEPGRRFLLKDQTE